MEIKELYEKNYLNQKVEINGWVRNHRKQKEFGFIADEIIKKIDEELKTDSFLCDNFYENFYLLKPLVFKNTVTTMIGCGVMPIGDFFMLGGQLIDKE